MQLLNKLLRGFFSLRSNRIELIRQNPFIHQEKWLQYLILNGKDSLFGKECSLGKGMSYSDFANAVPIHDYTTLLPYIERVIRGEQDVLWNQPIKWLAKSSGTTNAKSKYIPVSKDSLHFNNYLAATDSIIFYGDMFPQNHFFSGKGLVLGGCFQEMPAGSAVKIGDISAILLQNMPRIGDFLKASDRATLLHNDWNVKLGLLARNSYKQNVTSLSGVPSWMLLVLKEVLKVSGKEHIKEVWPNLELFFHGGVSFSPYIEEYKKMIPGDDVFYMNMYNASEGFFGFQDQKDSDDLLLLTDHAVFYEFIPMNEIGTVGKKAIPLQEVVTGQNYALVISTAAGLWRYVIGDMIKFTSTRPYRFKITGRTTHYINTFGEELIVDNADKALFRACEKTGASFNNYTAAPSFSGKDQEIACHEWMIEFITPPADMDLFTDLLDKSLQDLNSDYETKRTGNLILSRPKVHVAMPGTFIKWLETRNHLGGQHKVPRLQNDRKIFEELLLLSGQDR